MSAESPVLSVIVATWNRLPELRTMLDSLLPQVQGQRVETIIVDDRSTDETWDWLQTNLAAERGVTCLLMPQNSGPGPARNAGLRVAQGRYFVPVDSDFVMEPGAIIRILQAIEAEPQYPLLFFSCLLYPTAQRLDHMAGRGEISYETFVAGNTGELIPVADVSNMRARGLSYPALRAGGESLLWAGILMHGPALFLDTPVLSYRTDAPGRICTAEYQMAHPADLAAIADAMIPLFSKIRSRAFRVMMAQKFLAAGTYHLLAGNMGMGRRRLLSAAALGCWRALPVLAASFSGKQMFGALFRIYRVRLKRAYL